MINKEDLQIIRDYFQIKLLKIELRPNWGSETNGHREEIHGALKPLMTHASHLYDASISHTQGMGGFAFIEYDTDDVMQLGFDLEKTERVSNETVLRISTAKEFEQAQSAAHLWCAKEACFKALKGPHQPKLISQICIENWQNLNSQFETCTLALSQSSSFKRVKGLVFQKKFYTLSIFLARP